MKVLLLLSLASWAFVLTGCGQEAETIPSAHPPEPGDTAFVAVPGGTFTNSAGETVEVASFSMMRSEVNNRLYRYLADGVTRTHTHELP